MGKLGKDKMINIIIFSKDRACQLELLLRSMKFYFKEFYKHKINVLYTYSEDKYKDGYEKLFTIHNDSNVNYIKEIDFKNDVVKLLNIENLYTVFFVDDVVFKNPFTLSCKQFELFTLDVNILTLSLRLHRDLSYSYGANSYIGQRPDFSSDSEFKWLGQKGDYGYPMSLDGHFFRTEELIELTNILNFSEPNSYEGGLSVTPLSGSKIICFNDSVVFNNPINRVQTYNYNPHGKITASFLNDKFLNDYVIDFEDFKGIKNMSCHQEVKVKLIK